MCGAVPTHQRNCAALPFASMGKRGTAGRAWRPVPLPVHIYPTPASRPNADTDAAVAGRAGPQSGMRENHLQKPHTVQAGLFCVPTEPTAGISKGVNPGGGGSVPRGGWAGIRFIGKLSRAAEETIILELDFLCSLNII